MISAIANFFAFEIFNPAVGYREAIGTSIFYAMGIFAATAARKTQSILAQKTFLMSLRDQYRSAKLEEANRQLEILATCDPLTGLANRRSAESLVERLWNDRRIAKTTIAFMMADLDGFQLLNDTAGPAAGDACSTGLPHTTGTGGQGTVMDGMFVRDTMADVLKVVALLISAL